ncbi:hypothetical protein VTO42DRAFT_5596 [Malbranchea cinnamomea]
MAPPPEIYFPSLDDCFSGEKQLISWESAFLRTVSYQKERQGCDSLFSFLRTPDAVRILTNPFDPFPQPSGTTKSEFEAKTAAINVTKRSQFAYNLDEIKKDATWLSQKAKIDEVTALRIALLEWQDRPRDQLLNKYSREEINSLRDAVGIDSITSSGGHVELTGILTHTSSSNNGIDDVDSQEVRQIRLFLRFLSEKLHILKLAQCFLTIYVGERWALHGNSGDELVANTNTSRRKELEEIADQIFGKHGNNDARFRGGIAMQNCINAARLRLNHLEAGSGWSTEKDGNMNLEIELIWQESTLDELYQIIQILFLQLRITKLVPSAENLLSWLRLMTEYNFLELFRPATENQAATFNALRSLISVTSLAFLKHRDVLSYFEAAAKNPTKSANESMSSVPSILSPNDIGAINELFIQAADATIEIAGPSLFAWGMIMYALREVASAVKQESELREAQHAFDSLSGIPGSSGSFVPERNIYEEIFDKAHVSAFNEDLVKYLTSSAVDKCRVFDLIYPLITQLESVSAAGNGAFITRLVRIEFLDLIRSGVEFLDYMPDLVSAALHTITQPTYRLDGTTIIPSDERCDPRAVFLQDEVLMNRIFKIAKARFPFEAVNFLKICRALSGCHLYAEDGLPFIAHELRSMETYTQTVYSGFQGYRPIREDENANLVSLIQPLEMREVASTAQNMNGVSRLDLMVIPELSVVPAGAIGQVVNEVKPAVIMWHHQYNCLSFLGRWLEQETKATAKTQEADEETITEIVALMADLVSSANEISRSAGVESAAKMVLEMASDGLDQYGDIISVVFDIFERSLHDIGSQAGPNQNLERIISCIKFVDALVRVIPGRVWPFLARSSLLASDGKLGMLATIVSGVEASSGDFSFLLCSIRLLQSLVDDAITHAALRKTAGNVNVKSYHIPEYTAGIPSHVMRNCFLSLVRTMVEVYNSNSNWKFNDQEQQLQIINSLSTTFRDILYYVYGISDDTNLDAKVTGVLSSSAKYLLNVLRPTSNTGLPFNPILRIILDGVQQPLLTSNLRFLSLKTLMVRSGLSLAEILIQAGNLTKSSLSPLEKQLFKASPALIRLYALDIDYRRPVVTLLALLISYASLESKEEPPSLIGHLGAESCCHFLDLLSNFDRPFADLSLRVDVWNLLTTIVSKRQQWLAVYILTGFSPRDRLKGHDGKDAPAMRRRPFLAASLELLSRIESIPLQVAASALNFVSKSQEHWPPWVKPVLREHDDFFPKIVNYVSRLKMRNIPVHDQCLNTKIAYLVTDVCAIALYSAKEAWDWPFFKTVIPLVSWLSENAVQVGDYNASLHAKLRENFEMKYPGCKLLDIKRTSLAHAELGSGYYYDIELASRLFSYTFAWVSAGNGGFMEEVKRANLNLSLVETQVALLHSFKFFSIEHCAYFMPDRDIQKTMARVVRQCLTANAQGVPNENIFHRIQHIRAEFALALLQRLVDVRSKGNEVFGILSTAWEATRLRHLTYESALVNDDMEYYRHMLNILFLALQFHVAGPHRSDPEVLSKKPEISSDLGVVLEIVQVVVAQGFRALTTYLHEEPQKCSPKDFAVITAILQTALRVKDVNRIYERIAYCLAESETVRYAVTLFSWSYQFTIEGDPVYAELSILYLLELSCIPMIAEQMAAEGLLAKLSTYRITQILRQPQGCGPFDAVPRLYAIWNSFLRLCLNLLYHVGRAAPEVAAFLNQFGGQLRRSSECFSIGHPTSTTSQLPESPSLVAMGESARRISLSMASEAASLALISVIIRQFREAGPSAGIDTLNIQELKWDGAQVKDDIEVLLEKRSVLRSRIAATNERELAWSQRAASDTSSDAENLLEEKIVKELRTALSYLDGGESE